MRLNSHVCSNHMPTAYRLIMNNESREKQRKYQREWYKRNKERQKKWVRDRQALLTQKIRDYKLELGCKDCGYNEHFAALDFDHLGDKEYNIAELSRRGWCWERILREIEKCEVVCSNCHRIRTYKRLKPAPLV